MRRYRGGAAVDAEMALDGEEYRLHGHPGASSGPLAELAEALERVSREHAANASRATRDRGPRVTARSWMIGLLIAAGAFALIAAATVVTLALQGDPPPQKLDTIPPMPGG